MITPVFELIQDPDFLVLTIRVPYARTSEFDIYIDGEDFKFYAKPYFLRLSLPGRIVEDGREKASFDIDKGIFTLRVAKEITGQHFEGLQMLTSLLAPKGSRSAKPLVEEAEASGQTAGDEVEDEEFDWQLEQHVYVESSEEELKGLQKYGFGNARSGVFCRLQEELNDVIDLKDPDRATLPMRRENRLASETSAFSQDHYLSDLFEDESIQNLLKFQPWWSELSQTHSQQSLSLVMFSEEEKEQMRKFTNRSYHLDKQSLHHVWLSLVDIILAYTYEVRTTEGEFNVESSWTIRKLSGTLSWLENYHSLQDVLVSFGRRALCYPLYRHFSLVTTAVQDAARIFQAGKSCILKCLLDIHRIFRENDPAYILNDLYMTDYCVWIQKAKSKNLTSLADPLRKGLLQKGDLGLELEELEEAAKCVLREEEEKKNNSAESSDSSSSEDSDEDSEDSSSEETEEHDDGGSGPIPSMPDVPSVSPTLKEPLQLSGLQGGTRKPSVPKQLIQELGESLEKGLSISLEQPEGAHSRSSRDVENMEGEQEPRPTPQHRIGSSTVNATIQRTFLDVFPDRNPLLVVNSDNQDGDHDNGS
ncbi:protein SHQ1 homolog [Denticeps clupeoides]|uniref:Protein SHQ1 homolog n=1 Tax=Denticeps clupeoides TaxID=299321 RepID=A0AAY4E9V1_9TELE|nr:protein SHQ1 homolog [Denticeps clupeoides]XP_028855412.1 protein SHQ1 homolog [Denticeps clupeoides]